MLRIETHLLYQVSNYCNWKIDKMWFFLSFFLCFFLFFFFLVGHTFSNLINQISVPKLFPLSLCFDDDKYLGHCFLQPHLIFSAHYAAPTLSPTFFNFFSFFFFPAKLVPPLASPSSLLSPLTLILLSPPLSSLLPPPSYLFRH